MSLGGQFDGAMFHFSTSKPEEFMKAPTLHIGTASAASSRSRFFGNIGANAIYALNVDNLNVDDLGLSDEEANFADKAFLKHNNFPVPRSVEDSIPTNLNPRSRARAMRGFQSLQQNRGVTYDNDSEGGTSILSPSPQFNMHMLNEGRGLTPEQVEDAAKKAGEHLSREPITSPNPRMENPEVDKSFTEPKKSPALPGVWANYDVSDRTRRFRRYSNSGPAQRVDDWPKTKQVLGTQLGEVHGPAEPHPQLPGMED